MQLRFWEKVSLPMTADGCMVWRAGATNAGYGRFFLAYVDGKRSYTMAHRVAYTLAYGPIPDELEIDHTCGYRPCVRPDHLELVTQTENLARRIGSSSLLFCKNGHEFTEENTYVYTNKYSGRSVRNCRKCNTFRKQRARRDGK
jgi:hypothetical protein